MRIRRVVSGTHSCHPWPTRVPACSRQFLPLRRWIHHHTLFPSYCCSTLQDDLLVHLAHQPVLLQSHKLLVCSHRYLSLSASAHNNVRITALATANRSRVSIRGRRCEHFPHVWSNQHTQFCWCFGYYSHMGIKIWVAAVAPPIVDRGIASPHEPAAIVCYHAIFGRFKSNSFNVDNGPKISMRMGPCPPGTEAWLIPSEHASTPLAAVRYLGVCRHDPKIAAWLFP